jgi:hypothetical protein
MISTAHTLTADVPNTIKPFFDKRRDYGWQEREVFKAGTRMVLIRRPCDLREDILEVTIAPDANSDPHDPSDPMRNPLRLWWERPNKAGMMDLIHCLPHHVDERFPLNKKERTENEAYTGFINAIMGALSQPIHDYRSVWLHRGRASNDDMLRVLHRLHLAGKLDLIDITVHLAALAKEDREAWEAEKAAKAAKEKKEP